MRDDLGNGMDVTQIRMAHLPRCEIRQTREYRTGLQSAEEPISRFVSQEAHDPLKEAAQPLRPRWRTEYFKTLQEQLVPP